MRFETHQGFKFSVYDRVEDLPDTDAIVLKRAIEAREVAYAPYSEFLVGAAVLLENGEIVIGNNQENAAYPSGLCAERIAIFSAHANFPSIPVTTVAISSRNQKKPTPFPNSSCGACRQVMIEYELKQSKPIRVYFYGEKGEIWRLDSVKDLLPLFFHPEAL